MRSSLYASSSGRGRSRLCRIMEPKCTEKGGREAMQYKVFENMEEGNV